MIDDRDCPQRHLHTPCPAAYLEWHEWAEQKKTTHKQRRCPGCRLWKIWEEKKPVKKPTKKTKKRGPGEKDLPRVEVLTPLHLRVFDKLRRFRVELWEAGHQELGAQVVQDQIRCLSDQVTQDFWHRTTREINAALRKISTNPNRFGVRRAERAAVLGAHLAELRAGRQGAPSPKARTKLTEDPASLPGWAYVPLPDSSLGRLRAAGWSVAVHNDYTLNDERMTFWLFTHPSGVWAKGEGLTDNEALLAAERQARERRPEGLL